MYEREENTFFDISNASAQDLVDGGCRTSPASTPPLGARARGELKSSGKVFCNKEKTFPELSATLFLAGADNGSRAILFLFRANSNLFYPVYYTSYITVGFLGYSLFFHP